MKHMIIKTKISLIARINNNLPLNFKEKTQLFFIIEYTFVLIRNKNDIMNE